MKKRPKFLRRFVKSTGTNFNNAVNCTSLNTIVIPNSVTYIGKYAFDGCTSLTDIIIPNTVTNIGYMAIIVCFKLTSISITNKDDIIDDDLSILYNNYIDNVERLKCKDREVVIKCHYDKYGFHANKEVDELINDLKWSFKRMKIYDTNMMDRLLYYLHITTISGLDDIIHFWWYFSEEIYYYLEYNILDNNEGLEGRKI